ncbi:MAG: 2-oxoacid:acceptor oxidoreductase family protein [Candidatus Bathyarchaeota archaeon]|nr:MAG: 2-oxoacid:acceptor oxidoreductase family protein [Candidatus Bathyarchaeota archaeon]
MIGIRIHGRGGQGAVTASRLLAEAAFIDGKFSQAIPMYGTERRGAPLTAYVRFDDVRVRERELVHEPDIVVVLDPLISTEQSVAEGLKKGGLLILNTSSPPEEVTVGGDFRVATVDATMIALETLKRPITNTAILGAFSKAAGFPKLESFEKAILHRFLGRIGEMNIAAVRMSYERVSEVKQAPIKEATTVKRDIHVGGYGVLKDVSSWRVFTPKINLDKCTSCKSCWLFCPETAIKWVENKPEIEYHKCKGCGICVNECPVDAIEFESVEA